MKDKKNSLILLTVIIFGFLNLCVKCRVLKTKPNSNYFWSISQNKNVRIEKLFFKNELLETNYYSNLRLDSFAIIDYYVNQGYRESFDSQAPIDSFITFYFPKQRDKDSITIHLWLLVEQNLEYKYTFYKDSVYLNDIRAISPVKICKFAHNNESDTSNHVYYIRKQILGNGKNIDIGLKKLFEVKNRKINYHW